LRLSSFGDYGLALAALALVVFGAYDSYPKMQLLMTETEEWRRQSLESICVDIIFEDGRVASGSICCASCDSVTSASSGPQVADDVPLAPAVVGDIPGHVKKATCQHFGARPVSIFRRGG